VLANKFPRVNDQTVAFKERRLFLNFPNEFTGTNVIPNIERNWLQGEHDERSGIFNWCLKGLQHLLSQGFFTTSKTQEQTEIEFLRHSDTITAFINETGTLAKTFSILRSEAWEAYKTYCDFYGLENDTEKKFTARLKDTPKIGVCQLKDKAGTYQRGWKGVTFRVISESEEKSEAQTTLTNTPNTQNTCICSLNNGEKSSRDIEDKTGVFHVYGVLENSSEPKETDFTANSPIGEKAVFFERLGPSDVHKCDGLVNGHNCGFEAQFKTDNSFYCKTCLQRIGKDCYSNGFLLVEKNQSETDNLDGSGL
jgi:hypothetical protein